MMTKGNNMAIQKEHTGKKNRPTGEGESLASKPLHKLGDKAERLKPTKPAELKKASGILKKSPQKGTVIDPLRKTKIVYSNNPACR